MTYETHGLDTQDSVFFYEQDFYCLSNFSSFKLFWRNEMFATLEEAYHFDKFIHDDADTFQQRSNVRYSILYSPSAHVAFQIAQENKHLYDPKWNDRKVPTMVALMWAKVQQHEYVSRKLLQTGERELIENSWRDSFWGWGPDGDGQNMAGKCWMGVRTELRNRTLASGVPLP